MWTRSRPQSSGRSSSSLGLEQRAEPRHWASPLVSSSDLGSVRPMNAALCTTPNQLRGRNGDRHAFKRKGEAWRPTVGWTAGRIEEPISARAVIAFDLGEDFVERVLATAVRGSVVYAAVRSVDSSDVFGLVVLTERESDFLYTKAVAEDMGPAEEGCPARILDLLTEPCNERAREWRRRCRVRLARQAVGTRARV